MTNRGGRVEEQSARINQKRPARLGVAPQKGTPYQYGGRVVSGRLDGNRAGAARRSLCAPEGTEGGTRKALRAGAAAYHLGEQAYDLKHCPLAAFGAVGALP